MNKAYSKTPLPIVILRYWHDVLLGIVLSSLFFVASHQAGISIPSSILSYSSMDRWYEGGMPRVYEHMTTKNSNHERVNVHPLFPLTTHPIVYLSKKIFGFTPDLAVRGFIASIAAVWMFVLFVILRIIGCHRFDAILFCMLAAVSAASMFWFTVPETFSFGSLSIILALLVIPLSQKFVLSSIWYVLINILTFGFVITNWMAGLFVTLMSQPFRRTMRIIVSSFILVTVLWVIQKYIYPDVTFFLGGKNETDHLNLLTHRSGGPLQVATSFFYHTIIMPDIKVSNHWYWKVPVMVTQSSPPGSATIWGKVSVVIWAVLLLIGTWTMFSTKKHLKFRIVLGLLLIGQLILHIVYGAETFLYSLHFIVLLIPLVALGTLTKYRQLTIALLVILIPCVAINNLNQFNKSKDFLREHVNPQEDDARYRK